MSGGPTLKLEEEFVLPPEKEDEARDNASIEVDVSFEKEDLEDSDKVFPALSDWEFTEQSLRDAYRKAGKSEEDILAMPSMRDTVLRMMERAYEMIRETSGGYKKDNLWDGLSLTSKRELFRASLSDLPELKPAMLREDDPDRSIPGVGTTPIPRDAVEPEPKPEPAERPVSEVPGAGSGFQPVGEEIHSFERPSLSIEERLRAEVRAEYADLLADQERELQGDPDKSDKMRQTVERLGKALMEKRRKAQPEASDEELLGFSAWLERQLSTPASGGEKHVRNMTWPERRKAFLKYEAEQKETAA